MILGNSMIALSEWFQILFLKSKLTYLAHLRLIFLLPHLTTNCPCMSHGSQTHILYLSCNAFSVSCSQSYMCCFPPLSVIWKVLKKFKDDTAEAIIIIPHWPTQSWFQAALQMCIARPLVFESWHLELPGTTKKQPLSPKLELLVLHLSSDTFKSNLFRQMQKKLSLHPGGKALRTDMRQSLRNGKPFVIKGVSVSVCRRHNNIFN